MNFPISQPYSCVIIDDSRMSKPLFENFVSKIDKLELKGSFTDKVDAMAAFWTFGKIDFLFLDVQMDMSGLDVARMLKNSVKYVVILGAQGSQAIDAFANNCMFLAKPLDFTKFSNIIEQMISI
ncbi:response regulator [Pedobacter miscanthi]|uniref:Response regulatory domain-containing protein n=1 Tax=Pedobacter miscanthi TaxID=2259170 RepID=A0A366KV22_9SPHI|nr:response regulator [Pedobacter miscanthi]RBQ05487.1 hypothetical protein DRW42_15980 [Pedobacter miscanthi]